MYSEESPVILKLERQVKCIELDPLFSKSSSRKFVIGEGSRLTLYERTIFKNYKSTILCEAEGLVNAISWHGNFLAWASSIGIRVYDLNERCSLGLIKWEEPKVGRLSDFKCHLKWDDSTLLIGWADTIRICVIRKRNVIEVSSRNLPCFICDPVSTFRTDFHICGLATLDKNKQIAVLGVAKEQNSDENNQRPVLCAIRYENNDYQELCSDILTMNG